MTGQLGQEHRPRTPAEIAAETTAAQGLPLALPDEVLDQISRMLAKDLALIEARRKAKAS